jgi:ketosteroid isomerase-like protein
MKIRSVVVLAGLAIGFALPTFAQQTAAETPSPATTPAASATQEKETVDPKIRQQIEALDAKYDEAFNKHDAAAIAALYTEDGVQLTQNEVFSGREAIEKRYKSLLEGSSFTDHINKLDQVHTAFGVYTWAIGSWTVKSGSHDYKGFRFLTYLPEGGEWKISREVVLY